MSTQPRWHCIANLGDANPFEHGGAFLLVDRFGTYDPELWVWRPDEETGIDSRLYRFSIDQCFRIEDEMYAVSDNRYHVNKEAWFGSTKYIRLAAETCGMEPWRLQENLCTSDVMLRAHAYISIAEFHGYGNFDHEGDSEKPDMKHIKSLCKRFMRQIKTAAKWPEGLAK